MMAEQHSELSALLGRVRNRWRVISGLRAWTVAAAGAAGVLALALLTHRLIMPEGIPLILLWSVAGAAALACLVWVVPSIRRAPRDLQLARFIEEHCPELEDSLATAVGERAAASDLMVAAVVSDAVRRARELDGDRVISRQALRRTAGLAAAATIGLLIVAGFSAAPVERAARLLGLYLFPHRLVLDVAPGDVKVRAGAPLRVVAKISSGTAVVPVLGIGEGRGWRQTRMEAAPDGFAVTFERVERDFRYVVHAAGTSSREYTVTVIRPPRVKRIDLRYDYPPAFGMPARAEEDGGDIYGPAGTRVRVTVHASKPVTHAVLNVTGGHPIVLAMRGNALEGDLTIAADGSYRVALADADGLSNPGDTEYFIRTIQDRPPDVRIVRPASDRQVTPVEEVPIEARADDDFGVASLDLVYAVGGGAEKVVPFQRDGSGIAVSGRRTVYLEDLAVKPGDFVAYYARARDVSRGKRSSEARSDMFFLEVTPFEEEFVASQRSGSGAGDAGAMEDLIQEQKDIITATWNLDRRGREAGGRSQDDIGTVARAQRDLRTRVMVTLAQMQRGSDVRRRRQAAGGGGQLAPDAMVETISRAVEAMARALQQLDALNTADALPHEMAALNELLRAQAEVRRREVQQQQANGTGGRGSNRQQQDLSSLFDRELTRQQQTNYETPASRETRQEKTDDNAALDKIRELARRQDELNHDQQELAKNRGNTPAEELRRELERLTREQSELRRQVEELARQLQQGSQARQSSQGRQGGQSGQGGQGQQGQQGGQGQQGQQGGQGSDSRQQVSRDLQQVSEEMQGAASELRRENPQQASARGSRALERLRDLEQRMRGAQPGDRRRALGELQIESRQLADAERRLTGDPVAESAGDRADRARRRALEQERLADRAERLEQAVRQLAGRAQGADQPERNALNDAVQEIAQQKPAQRMRNAARADRQAADASSSAEPHNGRGRTPGGAGQASQPPAAEREEIARALDRLANRLGAAGGESEDSQRLSEELSRIRQLREQLAGLDRKLSELQRSADSNGAQSAHSGQPGGAQQHGGSEEAWQTARGLLDELRRENRLESGAADADRFNPGRSAPGTEAWKQDFAKWDELKVQMAAALERAEQSAADYLRDQQSRDRLNAGATQAVPEQYRRLVEKYYRALASGAEGRK